MSIKIEIDTDNLSAQDVVVITAIANALGGQKAPTTAAVSNTKTTAPAPAKKAAAPAAKAEPEPEPEPEEEGNDEGPTLADVVKRATELVSGGKAKGVKALLAEHDAAKVSNLKEDQIASFAAGLENL